MCENNNVCINCQLINYCDSLCKNCSNGVKCEHFNTDDEFVQNCEIRLKNQENTFESISDETENKEITSMDKLLESI